MAVEQCAVEGVVLAMTAPLFRGCFDGAAVLVTGHTGFKGAWLTHWLSQLGASVAGLALEPPSEPNLFSAIDLAERCTDYRGDVRSASFVAEVIEDVRPQYVFHLAAQPLVRSSYDLPVETFATNVMGTVNVLEAVRVLALPCTVVVITTDKCYQNNGTGKPYRESDRLGGVDPYSASKAAAEIVAASYRASYFGQNEYATAEGLIHTARAGNVIGGGDWAAERLVPDVFRALADQLPVLVRKPAAIRPWQHVLEALSGYLWLAACSHEGRAGDGEAWNFGPGESSHVSVGEVVDAIITDYGRGEWTTGGETAAAAKPEADVLCLDCSKARSRLGWQPVWGLAHTVAATVAWYRSYYDGGSSMAAVTTSQIADYVACARAAGLEWACKE